MALGTFSGQGLGMGVAFNLKDNFSKTADEIQRKMGKLGGYTDVMATKIDRAMDKIRLGLGATAVGALILAPFIKGIKQASDLEENINKVDVAFGKYADRIKDFSKTSLDNFGIDKIKALDMAALFGDMGTSQGLAQKDAAEMSETLVALAGDISSFKNISADDVQNKLKGIFTGETEALKGIGIIMTNANLDAHLASKGIIKSFKDLSEVEKLQTRFDFVMSRSKNAIGDFVRTSDGFANSKRVFEGSIKEMSATLGNILMPIAAKIFQVFSKGLKTLNAFAKSPVGKFILGLTAAFGGFLVVGGLVLMLVGGLRFAIFKMAGAFGAATKATLIQTIATKGAVAGLRAMAVAAWASLGPYVLIVGAIMAVVAVLVAMYKWVNKGSETMVRFGSILLFALGPIGQIVLAIAGIKRGFREFAEWDVNTDAKGGMIGFFMKVAGVLQAVGQIWKSFNGETFTLTKDLADKLEKLGLLGFVIELGQWISRLKTIFNGVVNGFRAGFQILSDRFGAIRDRLAESFGRIRAVVSRTMGRIKQAFQPLIDIFHRLTRGIFKNKGDLITWQKVANFIGNSIMLAFEAIATVLEWIITGVAWAIEAFVNLGAAVVDAFLWVLNGAANMYEIGVSFVSSIWQGIKSMWGSMSEWLTNKITAIFDIVKAPFKWVGDKIGQAWDWVTGDDDGDGDSTNGSPSNPALPSVPNMESTQHKNSTKSPMVVNNNTTNNSGGKDKGGTLVIQQVLDGKVLAETVVDEMEMKQARTGS